MRVDLVEALAKDRGYAVFSAAGEGEYAYSGEVNGIFTGALLAALRCAEGERFKTLRAVEGSVRAEVTKQSPGHRQHPELRIGGEDTDLVLFRCAPGEGDGVPRPPMPRISAQLAQQIEKAGNLLATGSAENVERSFRLYREVFKKLPDTVLASLNQGLLARVRQLEDDSPAEVGADLYQQLLHPLVTAPSRAD
jgi:hypothetical protein